MGYGIRARALAAAVSLLSTVACGSSDAPAAAPAAEPPAARPEGAGGTPVAAPATGRSTGPHASPTGGEAAATVPAPPPPALSREAAHLVREGRRAAREGRSADALRAFDGALAIVPGQPRVLCESGLLAHRAGDEADAARRIERALHAFGPPRHVSPSLREPLAMCLYNRGLVAEAEADLDAAVEAYAASVALRPSATVDAALVRARAASGSDEAARSDGDAIRVDGARVDGDLVEATDVAGLVRVLGRGMRSADEVWERAVVSVRETLHRPSAATELVVLHVDDRDRSYPRQWIVVAERVGDGYRVGALEVGRQDLVVSETEGDVRLDTVDSRFEADALIVRVGRTTTYGSWDTSEAGERSCSERSWHLVGETFEIVCAPGAACAVAPVSWSDSGETVHRECERLGARGGTEDEDRLTIEDEVRSAPSTVAVRLRVDGDALVVEGGPGEGFVLEPGRVPLAELDALPPPEWVADEPET